MQKANITILFSRTLICAPFVVLLKNFQKIGTGNPRFQNKFYFDQKNKNLKSLFLIFCAGIMFFFLLLL